MHDIEDSCMIDRGTVALKLHAQRYSYIGKVAVVAELGLVIVAWHGLELPPSSCHGDDDAIDVG